MIAFLIGFLAVIGIIAAVVAALWLVWAVIHFILTLFIDGYE